MCAIRKAGINPVTALKLFGVAALILSSFLVVTAQQQPDTSPKVEAKLIVGGSSFADPGIPHTLAGAALRVYITRRLSVESEFLYMRHDKNDQDYYFQPNLAYDFTDPTKRVVLYGIAGVGVFKHQGDFGLPLEYGTTFTTWTTSFGGGVKIYLTKRLFVAPEVRVGREPNVRGTVSVGYAFSGRK